LSISLSSSDLAAVDEVAAKFVMARRHAVVRAAFRAGIGQMVRDNGFAHEHLRREAVGEEIGYDSVGRPVPREGGRP